MIGRLPPYALHTLRFRFGALASHAGRATLGGDREVVLACFVASRIAAGLVSDMGLTGTELKSRAAAARQWLASISVPAPVRQTVAAVITASSGGDAAGVTRALTQLRLTASTQLDEASIAEIRDLADELSREGSTSTIR